MREKIEYVIAKLLLLATRFMPKSFIYAIFEALAFVMYRFDRKRRSLTIQNLSFVFLDKTPEQIKALSKAVYRNIAQTTAEIFLMFADRFDIDNAIVNKDEAIKRIRQLNKTYPGAKIVLTAHFGNWELLAHFLALHDFKMLVIGREGDNRLIEKYITTPFRRKYGNDSAYKNNAMLMMLKRLKQGKNVGILIDQKAGHLHSVKVDFLGYPAETTLSVATLSHKTNAVVIPFFAVRVAKGRYRIDIGEPMTYDETLNEADKEMTRRYSAAIEKAIRANPEQWFWMHNRWRR